MELLIKGGTLVTSDFCYKSDILISDEKIVRIDKDIESNGREVLDATGKLIFPGFIDTHTHFNLEGVCKTADDFYTGTRAAIAGGTTMVLDFATQERGMSSIEALNIWHQKADNCSSCDYGFHMSYTEWNNQLINELPIMIDEGITSFKLYMAYNNLCVDDTTMEMIFKHIKKVHGLIGIHCELGDLVNQGIQFQLNHNHFEPKYHPLSRPSQVEAAAISRCLKIADKVKLPVNIVHLSSNLGLLEVLKARKNGQKVYVETCPQYLLLDDSSYNTEDSFEGAKYVLSPPLRKKSDRDSLWKALKEDNIETIGTDHCSFDYKKSKEIGRNDFSKIPNGIPGVEHRPVLMFTYGVKTGKITINQMVNFMSTNPAKLFGLYPRKGVLSVGSDADIVIWNPDISWKIRADEQIQNVDYTPYEGMSVEGKVQTVLLRGKKVVDNYKISSENIGRFIKRGKSIYL